MPADYSFHLPTFCFTTIMNNQNQRTHPRCATPSQLAPDGNRSNITTPLPESGPIFMSVACLPQQHELIRPERDFYADKPASAAEQWAAEPNKALGKLPFVVAPSKSLRGMTLEDSTNDEGTRGKDTLEDNTNDEATRGNDDGGFKVSIVYQPPGWNMVCICVLPLPAYHQVEKFNAKFPKSKVEAVLLGLQENFRADSLTVKYQDGSTTQTTMARCVSMDGVKFVVQIWMVAADQYLVEIQRTGGDCVLFSQHRYGKRILNVVKRCSTPPPTDQAPPAETRTTDPLHISPEAAKEEQKQVDYLMKACKVPPSSEMEAMSSIEIAGELVFSTRFDQVAMGLDTCISMTDPNKSGWTVAEKTAKTILLGEENAPEKVKMLPDAIALLAFSGGPLPTMDKTDAEFAHYHAFSSLTIVAQAVNVWDAASTAAFVDRVFKLNLEPIDTLLRGVNNASTAAHVAYLSTHILAAVCHAVPSIREKIRAKYLPVVEHANNVGVCSHSALAQASSRLLQELSVGP